MYGCRVGTLGFTLYYIINTNATQPGSQASQTYVLIYYTFQHNFIITGKPLIFKSIYSFFTVTMPLETFTNNYMRCTIITAYDS